VRLFADQDVWRVTVGLLRQWGHDVVTAEEVGMSRSSDKEVLLYCKSKNRILVTRDKDFGHLVFAGRVPCKGVVLLRITPWNADKVHVELKRILDNHKESEIQRSFTIVEPSRHRIRKLEYLDHNE